MTRAGVMLGMLAPLMARADPTAQPENHAVCLLGERGAVCSTILLAELGLQGGAGPFLFGSAEAGLLINSGQLHAFGLSAGAITWQYGSKGSSDYRTRDGFAVEGRYRFWLGDRVGLDFGLGGGNAGALGDVVIEYRDIVGLGVGYLWDGSSASAATIGLRLTLWAVLAAAAH